MYTDIQTSTSTDNKECLKLAARMSTITLIIMMMITAWVNGH